MHRIAFLLPTMIVILYTFSTATAEDDIAFAKLRSRSYKYKKQKDRWALLGKLLLQQDFAELEFEKEHVLSNLEYTAYNKPFIRGSLVYFSIAHSEYSVVCALSTSCRLGIDLEFIRPIEVEAYYDTMSHEERKNIQLSNSKLTDFSSTGQQKKVWSKRTGRG